MLPVEPGAAGVHTRGVRVLFASTAGAGHFHPLKPFVEACLRQGDDVLVAGPPALADSVAGAGYAYWRFDEPPPDELGEVWSRVATVSADEANVIVIRDIFGRLDATAGLPRLRQGCEEWRPEVVVRETSEYGSAIAADLSGIPHVRVGIGLASLEELALGIVAETLDELRRSVGLAADPGAEALRRSPYLTMVPTSLEDPAALEPPTTLRFHDPAVDALPNDLPTWWAADDAPLVYVPFGSIAGGMEMTAPVPAGAGGGGRSGCPRPVHGRPRCRRRALRRGAAERPHRALAAPGRRPRPRRRRGLPRRIGVDPGRTRRRRADRRHAAVRRPAPQRPSDRRDRCRHLRRTTRRRRPAGRRGGRPRRQHLSPRGGAPGQRDARTAGDRRCGRVSRRNRALDHGRLTMQPGVVNRGRALRRRRGAARSRSPRRRTRRSSPRARCRRWFRIGQRGPTPPKRAPP